MEGTVVGQAATIDQQARWRAELCAGQERIPQTGGIDTARLIGGDGIGRSNDIDRFDIAVAQAIGFERLISAYCTL